MSLPLTIVAGESHFPQSQVTRHTANVPLVTVRQSFVLRRSLLVQWLPFRRLLNAEVVVCELNPRIISTWALLLIRRLLRRRTVVWGHAVSRAVARRPDFHRHVFRCLADAVVVYTEGEARSVRARMPRKPIYAAPNAVLHAHEMVARQTADQPHAFVYVGRLSPEKKPGLLLDAFTLALSRLEPETRLKVAGTGPLAPELYASAMHAQAASRVDFLGQVTELADLRTLYRTALASVSPGYAGLSLTQSLGFGVPMIIADREPHAPEIEAAVPGFNCVFFRSDDPEALAEALVQVERDAQAWTARADEIAAACRATFSVSTMVTCLVDAIDGRGPLPV